VELPAGDGADETEEGEDGATTEGGDETQPGVAFGPLYSRRLPAYHRLDLRASRRRALASGRGHLTVYLDVQNVYDRRNPSGFDLQVDDEEGVELIVERWPGIFPSLGVVWEF
jgi:outer membrane receptor protein involved in Fe transport